MPSYSATTSPATRASKYPSLTQSLKDYWLPEAQNNNKTNAKIFIIGNKLDAKRELESYSLDSLKETWGIHAFFDVSLLLSRLVPNRIRMLRNAS